MATIYLWYTDGKMAALYRMLGYLFLSAALPFIYLVGTRVSESYPITESQYYSYCLWYQDIILFFFAGPHAVPDARQP